MTESLFKHIGKISKLPLYPKSNVKLVGYGNRNIEYIGTTVINVAHLTQTKKATFYVTKLDDNKVILGLHLCIDLQLLSIHCDDKCQCKSQMLHETKKIGSEFPIGVDLQQTHAHQDVLPPVPISTKLESETTNYGSLSRFILWCWHHQECHGAPRCQTKCYTSYMFTSLCSPCSSTQTNRRIRQNVGVIRKLDINKTSDWVHTLVIVIKPIMCMFRPQNT